MSSPPAPTIAYLTNQYPLVSHTFIRREILALIAEGIRVERFSIRPADPDPIDAADRSERQHTRSVLDAGAVGLLGHALAALARNPLRWFAALRLAVRCGWNSHRGLPRHLVYFLEAAVLHRWLRAASVEHLHAHFATNSATVAMLCGVLGKVPFSFTAHGPEEFDKPEALALAQKLRRCQFVVAISEFGRSQLFRWCDYDRWDRVHVVRCAVDGAFLVADAPPPRGRRLVCVGRLGPEKGQLRAVEACAQLAQEGCEFELVLVGDGPFRPRIEALVRDLGMQNRVSITGWVDGATVREHILAARAMVLPSFAEGLPVVIMEALALRRPVISTYVAGIPELVEPGVSGWLVPPGSVEALRGAIRALMETDEATLLRMGRAGARRVACQHNATLEAQKLAALFRAHTGTGPRAASRAASETLAATTKGLTTECAG